MQQCKNSVKIISYIKGNI